jgi:hypothetical protein
MFHSHSRDLVRLEGENYEDGGENCMLRDIFLSPSTNVETQGRGILERQ